MAARCFLDTNILVYAAAGRDKYPHEHAVASRIVAEGAYAISAQVLGEFYHVIRHLQHEALDVTRAQEWVRRLRAYCEVDVDAALIGAAAFVRERFKIQFWDAALIAAAQRLKLPVLYSQDMSHRQKYGSVTVINPFGAA
ncbi:PIN domain-containing protein [Aestuariivirga sp.]|uniref:PIN domain-containing protein n=1 Tax=Aestuariivirga sp. TaxID=2650926 RepID=UPI0025C53AF8|nr:PIN domain-containing protein [Aestuariivirga sp.]MCA3556195.1 PIN domain-containing protein [Aestuariivirga sp.]